MPRAALAVIVLLSGVAWGVRDGGGGCAGTLRQASNPKPSPVGERDVLAWARIESVAGLAMGAGESLGPRGALQHAAIGALGLPAEASVATDWSRPTVVALLDPQKFGAPGPTALADAGGRPVLALLAVRDEARMRRALDLQQGQSTGAFRSQSGMLWVDLRGGTLVMAPEESMLTSARKMLEGISARRGAGDVNLHISLHNIFAAYGDRAERVFAQVAELSRNASTDGSSGFAMRSVRRLAAFASSAEAVDVSLRVAPDGLAVTARMSAQPTGEWASYIKQQRPQPMWGAELLPPESVLVYTTTISPAGMRGELEDSLDYLGEAAGANGGSAGRRAAMTKALSHASGEVAYAVWPAAPGGVGMGGAYRLSDAAHARQATLDLHAVIRSEAAELAARALDLPARTTSVQVKPAAVRRNGVPIDLVELRVKWPRQRKDEKRAFEWMFGKKLILATAVVGDRAIFALGRDAMDRTVAMIKVSQGDSAPSVKDAPGFDRAVRFQGNQRVSMSYLPLGRMVQFIERLVHATAPQAAHSETESLRLAGSPESAIVSTTNIVGNAYEVTTFIPRALLGDLGATGGALWRIAFQPVLNPPPVPPLPVPPAQLTPPTHVPQPTEHDEHPPGRPVGHPATGVHPV
jgi:hypothetical protein